MTWVETGLKQTKAHGNHVLFIELHGLHGNLGKKTVFSFKCEDYKMYYYRNLKKKIPIIIINVHAGGQKTGRQH